MLTMDSKAIRFLARMGSRGVLGQVIYELLCENNDLYVVSADLAHASGFDRIGRAYPERLINVGIAEQNLIGIAAGLSYDGNPVFATTWGMFASARVADQVRNYLGFMQSNVKLIGMDSGLVQSGFSYSHTNPPDIAIMRTIPGISVLSPCDGIECYKAIYAAYKEKGPVYVRLTGDTMQPIIHKSADFEFVIGKSIVLREGTDVAIIGCGNILKEICDAADILMEKGVDCRVIDMHTIAPLDGEMLDDIKDFSLIVSVEEHLCAGGMGSAIAEYYSDKEYRPRHIIMGIDNMYTPYGTMEHVMSECKIKSEDIADAILSRLNKEKE